MVLGALLLAEPDLGAATVLFVTGFGLLFLAGAQLRWVVVAVLGASAAMSALVMFSELPHASRHRLPQPLGRSRTTPASSSRSP